MPLLVQKGGPRLFQPLHLLQQGSGVQGVQSLFPVLQAGAQLDRLFQAVAVLVAIPGVIILGVLLALFQRIKEIQKGEEDDAKNY